jgi:nucleotide-binding universal stress UspA family protein
MKIVLGFDDSPHAVAALKWIVRNEKPADTQVTIVSAVRTPVTAYAEVYAPAVPVSHGADRRGDTSSRGALQAGRGRAAPRRFSTSVKVLPGDPREALVETARTEKADLLIVGSHGRTGLPKLLLGSVASHAVSHAPCDVLVVKKPV